MILELKDVKLPTIWSEINTKQMRDMIQSQMDKNITVRQKYLNYIQLVTYIPMETLKWIDDIQLEKLYKRIEWFDKVKIKDIDMTNYIIELDGIEYGISNIDEKTLDEFIDGESSIDISEKLLRIEEVIAISVRPIEEKFLDGSYRLEPYDNNKCNARRNYLIENINAEIGYNIYTFFLFKGQTLSEVMLAFLSRKMEKLQTQIGSIPNGDG